MAEAEPEQAWASALINPRTQVMCCGLPMLHVFTLVDEEGLIHTTQGWSTDTVCRRTCEHCGRHLVVRMSDVRG